MIRGLINKVFTRYLVSKAKGIVLPEKPFKKGIYLQLTFIISH